MLIPRLVPLQQSYRLLCSVRIIHQIIRPDNVVVIPIGNAESDSPPPPETVLFFHLPLPLLLVDWPADTSHHRRPGLPFTFATAMRRMVSIRHWSVDKSIKLAPSLSASRASPTVCAAFVLCGSAFVVGFKLSPSSAGMFQFLGTEGILAKPLSIILSRVDQ
jgi:hypothetical protein